MHKIVFLAALNIILFRIVYAQQPVAHNSIFWQISGKHIKPTYLFGTMHVIGSEEYLFPESFQAIIRQSDQVVLEMNALPSQDDMLKLVQLPSGSFFDYFSSSQHDSIINWASQIFNMNTAKTRMLIGHMRPIMLSQLALSHTLGNSIKSYEQDIIDLAKTNKTKLIGLETFEFQLNLINKIDSTVQHDLIMEYVRNPEHLVEEFNLLSQTYASQNLDSLNTELQKQVNAVVVNDLLITRNQAWLKELPKILSPRKSTFIAVGAGHLGGENGLVSGLIKQGYTLTPLRINETK